MAVAGFGEKMGSASSSTENSNVQAGILSAQERKSVYQEGPSRKQIEKYELPSLLRARNFGFVICSIFSSVWFVIALFRFFGFSSSSSPSAGEIVGFIIGSNVILFLVILTVAFSGALVVVTLLIPHHLAKRDVKPLYSPKG